MWKLTIETLKIQLKNSWSRAMFRFTLIFAPVLSTILLYEMFKNSSQIDYLRYVVLGGGLMGLWGSICFSTLGDFQRERYMGTLVYLFTAPSSFTLIVLAKALANTLLSSLTFVLSFLTAIVLDMKVFVFHPYLFVNSMFITLLSFMLISVPFAYIMTLSRKTMLYMNLIELPIIILSGFVFPIEQLPFYIRIFSYVLSTTWSSKILTEVLKEKINWGNLFCYHILLIVILLIYILITFFLWQVIRNKVRKKATLELR